MRHVETRPGLYRDSVALMQVSSALSRLSGVSSVLVAMATELNLDLLAQMGFEPPAGAGPNDMLVAIETADAESLPGVLASLESALAGPVSVPSASTMEVAPRTTASAARRFDASL